MNEKQRETLNHIHEDMTDLVSHDDLVDLCLALERRYDDVKNECTSKLADIGIEALKQLNSVISG